MISIILFINALRSQGVSVSNSNEAPDPSAILDVQSTGQGVLFSRMTTAQRDAIQNPADGLHIFNLDTESLEYYDSSYRLWISYCPDCTPLYDTLRSSNDVEPVYINYTLPDEAINHKKIHIVIESEVIVCGSIVVFYFGPAIDLWEGKPGAVD